MEDSGRESQVKSSMLCKSFAVSICDNYISIIASIDGEDSTVACVGFSRLNIAEEEEEEMLY